MLATFDATARGNAGDHATDANPGCPVDIVPFEPWHLEYLTETTAQAWLGKDYLYGRNLQRAGPCYTAFAGEHVIACAGVFMVWDGRAQAWSMLSTDVTRYVKTVFRETKRFLDGYLCRRIECTVDPRSEQAKNWARHLGFNFNGLMPAYTPGGDDMELWAMVRPWL